MHSPFTQNVVTSNIYDKKSYICAQLQGYHVLDINYEFVWLIEKNSSWSISHTVISITKIIFH